MSETEILSFYLKEKRKELKLSQFDLASGSGLSTEIISLYERQKGDPKLSSLQKLACYLDTSVSDILKIPEE